MLSNIEPDLRQIIGALQGGNLEAAQSRTVLLIESVLQMSNPMYREDKNPRDRPGETPCHHAPGSLRTLAQDLRDVSRTLRRGIPADALVIAERALAVLLRPEALAGT